MLSKLWPIFKHCCLGKEKLKNCEACESGIQECICSSKLQDVPPYTNCSQGYWCKW